MTDPTCDTCRFWSRGSNQPRNAKFYAEQGGECRKNPPRGGQFNVYYNREDETDTISVVCFPFPPTHEKDWCGEWSVLTSGD